MIKVKKYNAGFLAGKIGIQIPIIFWALIQLYPLYWLLMSSFKPTSDILAHTFQFPKSLYLDNYIMAFGGDYQSKGINASLLDFMLNSTIVTICSLILIVVIAYIAAYAIAKIKFWGKNIILIIFIATLGIPIHTLIIPIYYFIGKLGLLNNFVGLILPYTAFSIPFSVLLLQAYFKDFPDELIEAAKIDGCGDLGAFLKVVFPISLGAISMVLVMNFIGIWNEFLLSLIILKDVDKKTLPVGLLQFKGTWLINWGALFAGIVIAILPTIIIYLIFHRNIVKGISAGAIKE